jgi:hypothetical protein
MLNGRCAHLVIFFGERYFKNNNYSIENFILNIIIFFKIVSSIYYFSSNNFNIKNIALNIIIITLKIAPLIFLGEKFLHSPMGFPFATTLQFYLLIITRGIFLKLISLVIELEFSIFF